MAMRRLTAGDMAPNFEARTIRGRVLRQDTLLGRPTLLLFHRYARCAVCHDRIRRLTAVLPELIEETGLRAWFVCHSDRRRLMQEFGDREFPFEVIPDPEQRLYETFGVAKSLARTLRPASVISIFRARKAMPNDGRGAGLELPLTMIPADFFIDPQARIVSSHYGEFLGDSWPIETIERLALNRDPPGKTPAPQSGGG